MDGQANEECEPTALARRAVLDSHLNALCLFVDDRKLRRNRSCTYEKAEGQPSHKWSASTRELEAFIFIQLVFGTYQHRTSKWMRFGRRAGDQLSPGSHVAPEVSSASILYRPGRSGRRRTDFALRPILGTFSPISVRHAPLKQKHPHFSSYHTNVTRINVNCVIITRDWCS